MKKYMNINVSKSSSQKPSIQSQLDSLSSIIESGDTEAIALASEVIQNIKKQVEGLQEVPESIVSAINEISEKISILIPDGGLEIEYPSMIIDGSYGEVEIFSFKTNLIIFSGDRSYTLQITGNESMVLNALKESKGCLEVNRDKQDHLNEILIGINDKLLAFGVCIVIDKDLICGFTQVENFSIPLEDETDNNSKIEIDSTTVLSSTTLVFGNRNVGVKILKPLKNGNKTTIPCIINGKNITFSKPGFKAFLRLLDNPENPIEISHFTIGHLYAVLEEAGLSLLRSKGSQFRLIFNADNKVLVLVQGGLPDMQGILNKSQKIGASANMKTKRVTSYIKTVPTDIPDGEQIDITVGDISIKSGQKTGAYYSVSMQKKGDLNKEEAKSISLPTKRYKTLLLFSQNIGIPQKIPNPKLQSLKSSLQESLGDNFIKNLHGKGHYIGELSEKYTENNISRKSAVSSTRRKRNKKTKEVLLPKGTTASVYQQAHARSKSEMLKAAEASREDSKNVAKRFIENADANLQKSIVNMFLKNPGKFFTKKEIIEVFEKSKKGDTDSILSSLFLEKASHNSYHENIPILEHPERGFFLLDMNKIDSMPQKQCICYAMGKVGTSRTLLLLTDFDCIVTDDKKLLIDPQVFIQKLDIQGGKISIKKGPGAQSNANSIRAIIDRYGLTGFISIASRNTSAITDRTQKPITFRKKRTIKEKVSE